MTTFLLARHGLNDAIAAGVLAGWTDVALNAEGRAEAESLGERLAAVRIDAIVASPLRRARETAEPLARRLGLPVATDAAFGEVQLGDWTGREIASLVEDPGFRRWNRLRSLARVPNGETMAEVQVRVVSRLEQMRLAQPEATIAIFSHGDPIRAALLHALGMPIDHVHRIHVETASVSVMRIDEHAPRVLAFNHRGDLRASLP